MTARSDSVRILSRALDQTGDLFARVRPEHLALPTPCSQWTVAELVAHLARAPLNFIQMVRGEQPDWSAVPDETGPDRAVLFRSAADDLIHAWHQLGEREVAVAPDMATAEFAVHGWDLATALGLNIQELNDEVAERALAFMQANLTTDLRGVAFGPERAAPADAGAYERLAAYAGRSA